MSNEEVDILGRKDIRGNKYGDLTVIRPSHWKRVRSGAKHLWWICRCGCGEEIEIRAVSLERGKAVSCGKSCKKAMTDRFLIRAKEVHGETYDYSAVKPVAYQEKVEIICRKHGAFLQRKDVHLRGGGCKQCRFENMPLKRTVEEVVSEFKEIFGDKYDYSLVDSSRTTDKVSIVCPEHGVFRQTIAHHKNSRGCPECSLDEQRLSYEEFLKRCEKVHGDRYDYSEVKPFKGGSVKVPVICKEHGVFMTTAGSHSRGNGCHRCAVQWNNRITYSEYDTDFFIKRSVEIHGNKFDYSKTKYIATEEKVVIICPIHGDFEQAPASHLSGRGCTKCRDDNQTYNFIQKYRDNVELGDREGLLYVIRVIGDGENFYKLGITSDLRSRMKILKGQFKKAGYTFEYMGKFPMPNYQSAMLENAILKEVRRMGLMYLPRVKFSGWSECFTEDAVGFVLGEASGFTVDKYYKRNKEGGVDRH